MPDTGSIPRKPAAADELFGAFSDRTRLRILNILTTGETCVCDLMRVLGVPQAKVSRHLARLRKAGLVTARKDGLWHHYSLAAPRSPFHAKLIECLGCCMGEVPELKRDLAKLNRTRCGDSCC
jgi:ArsR family transcriptional regulator, arsenate/arsenite/antimonite-responsive transcriptional repressor